ncbi:MAG TPA: serine hydrolase domain-containing protein [Solirubrobacterales bacterium]
MSLIERLKAPAIGAFLAAALVAPLPAAASASELPMQRALNGVVEARGGPPGVFVVVQRKGLYENFEAGVAKVGAEKAPARSFRIASVSKAFNAFLAVLLERQGKLSLNERVHDAIPGVLPKAENVTLRQLLQHTSGIPDYIRAPAFVERFLADPTGYLAPHELTGFVRDTPLEFQPGSRYHYSDTDNIAAALMMEAATGSSYAKLLETETFGLRNTTLPSDPVMPKPFIHGYEVEAGKKPEDVSEAISPSGAWASGGIVSTLMDLTRFAQYQMPLLVKRALSLKGAFRRGSSSPPGPGRNFAGLGIFRYVTACGTVYGHTGSFPGYRILLAGTADGSRTVAFVVNAQVVPGQGSPPALAAILKAQRRAVCRALAPRGDL